MNDRIKELESEIYKLSGELMKARGEVEPEPVGDFSLETPDGPVMLSELFGDKNEMVLIHNMGKSCSYCTMWADCLEGSRRHLETRCALVLVSPDDPATQQQFAAERGWTYRLVSDPTKEFTTAMGYWTEDNGWWPGTSTFRKLEDGSMVRTGRTYFGPGDAFCPPWQFFSLLGITEGEWEPS